MTKKKRGNLFGKASPKSKKAQTTMGMPFVFIMAIIVGAIVVIFAVKTIGNLTCNQEQIQINMFITDLKKEIEKTYYASTGSQVRFSGTLPSGGCSKLESIVFATDSRTGLDIHYEPDHQLYFIGDTLNKANVAPSYNIKPGGIEIALEDGQRSLPINIPRNGKIELLLKNDVNQIDNEIRIVISEYN